MGLIFRLKRLRSRVALMAILSLVPFALRVIAFYLLPLGFAAIMIACVTQPRLVGRTLMNGPAYFFSKISYSWYLVHLTIVPGTLVAMNAVPGFREGDAAWRLAAFFPVYVAVSLVGALALHFAVEKPFLILKDRARPSEAPDPQSTSDAPGIAVELGSAIPRESNGPSG